MKPFEDSIPEEQKEKLVELLRGAYRQDQMLFEREQQASLARVAERLARLDEDETPYIVSLPKSVRGSSWFNQQSKRVRSKGRVRLISVLAAVLVVGILVSSAALIFTQSAHSPTGLSYTPRPGKLIPMVAPVVVKRGGLEMSMQVTQGPYFLGELLAVDLSLTNHTHSAIKLFGKDDGFKPQQGKSNNSIESPCSSFSLHPEQTGGTGPYYTLYTETVPFVFACGEIGNGPTFVAGQTIVDHFYVLLTSSGEITLTGTALFAYPAYLTDPLKGHLPTLHIYVASQVPADRQFLLQSQGSNVLIYAPTNIQLVARTYLLCKASFAGRGTPSGDDYWKTLTTNTLQRPACPTTSWWSATDGKEETTHWASIQWKYAVGAVGYAVVQGESVDAVNN